MPEELMNGTDVETIFSDISTMIYDAKNEVMLRVNTSVITLYWNIGKKLSEEVLQGKKPEYGKNIIGDLSERLTAEYGKGFEKSSVFKMVKFYQEFPEYEKVSTLSQQLTWSHFVELLPIEDVSGRADSNGIKLEEKDYLDAEIVFENVSFIYPNQEKKSLSNINLTIKKGERISIVGENGAGKTTFIKLLLRLYEPTEGRILFNGIDIRDIDYQDYQKIFSTVFQDYKLFAFRIIDNITSLEGNEAEKEKVMKCLEKAGLSSKIEKLEHGLDTYLYNIYDEEGIELSGGESQKLAIARALYKDSPIVILDEPTAALDPRAEYEIYTRFLALVESKTSIFISHRLSSTKLCDRIVLFKDGSIEETGTHNELLQKGGLYAELFRMQAQFYFDN